VQDPNPYLPPARPYHTPAPPPVDTAPEVMLEPGGFAIRAVAHLIDLGVTMVLGLASGVFAGIVLAVLDRAGSITPGGEQRVGIASGGSFVLGLVASLLYHAIAEGLGGATAGKAIVGLRVLTEDQKPCTFPKALGRNLAYYFDALFFGLVAWSSMSSSPMRQRYGDKWAKTIVVRARSAQGILTRSPLVGVTVSVFGYGAIQLCVLIARGM